MSADRYTLDFDPAPKMIVGADAHDVIVLSVVRRPPPRPVMLVAILPRFV
jgi:hypothetical protein